MIEQQIQANSLKPDEQALYLFYNAKILSIICKQFDPTISVKDVLSIYSKEIADFSDQLIQSNKYISDFSATSGELKKLYQKCESRFRDSQTITDLFTYLTPLADNFKKIWLDLFWVLVSGVNSKIQNLLLPETILQTHEVELLKSLYKTKHILKAFPFDNPNNNLRINPFNDFEIWQAVKEKLTSIEPNKMDFTPEAEDKTIWEPTKGWDDFNSKRALADELKQTENNINYHLKNKTPIYTKNIKQYEGKWYLFKNNKKRIIESMQTKKQSATKNRSAKRKLTEK